MVQLAIYLISLGLIVLGALCFVSAMSVKGRVRVFLACVAACVPIGVGVWLFHSAGLRPRDLDRLLRQTSEDVQGFVDGLKKGQESRQEIQDLLSSQPLNKKGRF